MLQSRVEDLFHAEHLGPQSFFCIVDSPIRLREANIYGASKIIQTLVVDQNAVSTASVGKAAAARAVTNWSGAVTCMTYQMNSLALSRLS